MIVLTIDVGGTHVKFLTNEQSTHRKFVSGPTLTPQAMVEQVRAMAADWPFDVVSMGYPGPVQNGKPAAEPFNLAPGWVDFDYEQALGHPVKIVNDAAMQAFGSYTGGKMLFLGLGTGLGSAMVVENCLLPMEVAHLPYRKQTFEDYVGLRGLKRAGKKKWRRYVLDVVARLQAALLPDYIVLGGGNSEFLKEIPANCRLGANTHAFIGGFRLWHGVAYAPTAGSADENDHSTPPANGTPRSMPLAQAKSDPAD